jgi:hypothetical protein
MSKQIYVNKKQKVKVTINKNPFGIHARIEKNNILGYEGMVSSDFVTKMIQKLELTESKFF